MNIIILGATTDRTKFANKAVRAYSSKGYTVYPVNPNYKEVEGLKCYAFIHDVPKPIDVLSIYVSASVSEKLINEIINAHPGKIYFNPGSESASMFTKLKNAGLNVLNACSIRALGMNPNSL